MVERNHSIGIVAAEKVPSETGDATFALIMQGSRAIGSLIPDVVIEEIHKDTLAITKHPVETGAAIADHSFLLPWTVLMKIGASDSGQGPGYVREVYDELLSLQASRKPMTVVTGKRSYKDMLIASILVTTDAKSENALNAAVELEHVFITSTESTGGSTKDTGLKQPKPAPGETPYPFGGT